MLSAYKAVFTIVLSAALVACGSGMLGAFMPVHLSKAGLSTDQVGSIVTSYALGMLLACFFSGRLIRRVGHIRSYAAFGALSGTMVLALSWQASLEWWLALRFVHGFASNSVFMVMQSWLNERTESRYRGQVMAFFYVLYTVFYGSGALLLAKMDIESLAPFMIGCGLFILSIIPISTTKIPGPPLPEKIKIDLKAVYRLSPVGSVGAFVSGATGMTLQGVGAIYGTLLGLTPAAIGILMASTQAGNLVIQWPLGFLSDRIDRRLVLIGAAGAAALISIFITGLNAETFVVLIIAFGVFGGMAEAIYSISTAHANDWAEGDDYVTLSSTILVVWAVGATLGALVATQAMSFMGPSGLPIYTLIIMACYGLFAVFRMFARSEPPEEAQETFEAVPPAPVSADFSLQPTEEDETSN